MNDVYFVCRTCKTYHDAGYRWCWMRLEKSGVVERGKSVSVDAVLQAEAYWEGVESGTNIGFELRAIRAYLVRHRDHDLIYDENTAFYDCEDELDWLDENEQTAAWEVSPRYLVEILGFTEWSQVVEYIHRPDQKSHFPQWWCWEDEQQAVKYKFEELVRQQSAGNATPSNPA